MTMTRDNDDDDPPSPISPILPSSPPTLGGRARRAHHDDDEMNSSDAEDDYRLDDDHDHRIDADYEQDFDNYDDDDEYDDEFGKVDARSAGGDGGGGKAGTSMVDDPGNGVGDGSSMSLPADQRRHLAEMESSFRGNSSAIYLAQNPGDADLSIVGGGGLAGRAGARSGSSPAPHLSHRSGNRTLRRVGDMGPPIVPASAYRSGASSRSSSRQQQLSQQAQSGGSRPQSRSLSLSKQLRRSVSSLSNLSAQDAPDPARSPSPPVGTPNPHAADDDDAGLTSSASRERRLEDISSPTVAAQSRNISRVVSGQHRTPSAASASGDTSNNQRPSATRQASASSADAEGRITQRRSRRRLRNRRSSVRSTVSSMGSASVSEMEDGHSAAPAKQDDDEDFQFEFDKNSESTERDAHRERDTDSVLSQGDHLPSVSRHASFGSTTTAATVGAATERALARLDEEERLHSRTGGAPSTPKANPAKHGDRLPTDTTIAAHIRNIQIPPSVTRDFQKQQDSREPLNGIGGASSPSKKPPGTASKNMTLKEQSGIIDRLQKENFDLKLKVYYLNDKLEKASEEGVAEMTRENVELRMKILEMGRLIKTLKKRTKDLEKENGRQELANSIREGSDEEGGAGTEVEASYWQERADRLEVDLETSKAREVEREAELRKLSEIVRGMTGGGEEMEILRDILDSETVRREQAEADNVKLRDEIWQLKARAPSNASTTIRSGASSRARGTLSHTSDTTLVSQLRMENEDLRREVSAQTSMLTSRNREKERLYQEIEDLKLGLLRTGANERGAGGDFGGSGSRAAQMSEAEREEYENANGQLRDRVSELKLRIQDLEIELETRLRELDVVTLQRQEFSDLIVKYEEELELLNADLQAMQEERNESLKFREELEIDFDALKAEAEDEIQRLDEELEMRLHDIERLEAEVSNKEENFTALQAEMHSVSEVLVRLEDTAEEKNRRVQLLEAELEKAQATINENETELTALEKQLMEATEKGERLGVQQESAQGEISFLREEQDGDKIKIGELQGALKAAEETLKDEQERARRLQDRLVEERKLREETRDLNKQEFEKILNEKSQEILNTKESNRQMKKTLTRREQDVKEWKDRLGELENALREALGSGTRAGMLRSLQENLAAGKPIAGNVSSDGRAFVQSIVNLQLELEQRMEELNNMRHELAEKEATIKDRENLMESMALETKRFSELLEKERIARKSDRAIAENLSNSNAQSRKALEKHQSQLSELEKARNKDSKALIQLEAQYKEQIAERNSILVQLWQRLSGICGTEWAHKNQLLGKTGTPQPAEIVVGTALQNYGKGVLLAIKTIEGAIAGFKTRCKNVERDLWKEYQVVENTLETRTRRLERLESMVRDGVGEQSTLRTDLAKLRTENRLLKAELNVVRLQPSRLPQRPGSGTSTPGGGDSSTLPIGLSRAHSSSVVPSGTASTSAGLGSALTTAAAAAAGGDKNRTLEDVTDDSERRWILRLRELEKRLAAEREARVLERTGAKLRLEEMRGEQEGLKRELERERASSRLTKRDDEEEDRLLRPTSRLDRKHRSDRGKSAERDDDVDVSRSSIARSEKDRDRRQKSRERREKSRDRREKDRDRDHHDRERERDRHRDRQESKAERPVKEKDREKDRDRNSERGSHKSSSASARSMSSSMKRTDSSSKRGMQSFGAQGGGVADDAASVSSSKKDGSSGLSGRTSPRKEGSALSPRKLFDFMTGGKEKERRGSEGGPQYPL